MTPDQISVLAATGEAARLEFKHTTDTRREAMRTVCAMLNQEGGHAMFGVAPVGTVVGQQVCAELHGLSHRPFRRLSGFP